MKQNKIFYYQSKINSKLIKNLFNKLFLKIRLILHSKQKKRNLFCQILDLEIQIKRLTIR